MSRSLIRKNQLHPDINDLVGQYGSGYFISNQPVVYTTGNQTISGQKTFIGNQRVTGNLNISGALITSQSRNFIYSGAIRGTGNLTGAIAYGANCTITPMYAGRVRADASVSMTTFSIGSTDVFQATTFWYGTGIPPVFSGNLNNLAGSTRIGGNKGLAGQQLGSSSFSQSFPVGASWVAEITGLTTGTRYWFDIGISGSKIRVQDVQIYVEEKS